MQSCGMFEINLAKNKYLIDKTTLPLTINSHDLGVLMEGSYFIENRTTTRCFDRLGVENSFMNSIESIPFN